MYASDAGKLTSPRAGRLGMMKGGCRGDTKMQNGGLRRHSETDKRAGLLRTGDAGGCRGAAARWRANAIVPRWPSLKQAAATADTDTKL